MVAHAEPIKAPAMHRCQMLYRTLLVVDLLAPLRFGATTEELHHDVCELSGVPCCLRTVRRDLDALELLGVVCCVAGRWRLTRTPRAESVCAAAERAVA